MLHNTKNLHLDRSFIFADTTTTVFARNEDPTPRASGTSNGDGDKWRTIAIETLGQKYIAQRQRESEDGVMYSVFPIVEGNDTTQGAANYVEVSGRRFTINVQMIAQSSRPRVPRQQEQNVRKPNPSGRHQPKHKDSSLHKGNKSSGSGRKAVGAKKPSSNLTAAGRRILAARQRRNNTLPSTQTAQGM